MPEKCPQCGAPLPAGVLTGLCPACLLKQGAAADSATKPEAKAFEPPPLAEVARLFPQLEILGLLGKGGMGAVYKARQPSLDRLVALKILRAQTSTDGGFAERFTREARALARLSHPNIVAVHEFGQVGGAIVPPEVAGPAQPDLVLHYFVMEFVDGVNLRQLERTGRLSPREALQIVPQICDALQYAHDEGIVHRDIKPENVLVDRKGRVKIADFGLAKIMGRGAEDLRLTAEGQVMGTPHYMAPEQVERPLEVDHRADIYALGVVFYEMLTGELPLGRFQPPSRKAPVDMRLDEVVLHALEKEPEHRYQHASQVKTDVETIVRVPGSTRPSVPQTAAEPVRAGLAPEPAVEVLPVSVAQHRGRSLKVLAYGVSAVLVLIGIGIGVLALLGFPTLKVPRTSSAVAPGVLLKGTITDRATGRPIAGARVTDTFLNRGRERPTRTFSTDTTGRFELRTWNEGDHAIKVSGPGYRVAELPFPLQPAGSNQPVSLDFRLEPTNWVSALTETWSPATEPADDLALRKIIHEASDLTAKGRYEDAFQRFLWYHNHALEYGGSNPSRLTTGLSDWAELSRRYPKARQALLEVRDRARSALLDQQGTFDLFMEFSRLNQYLQDDEETYRMFKTLERDDPALAERCYPLAEALLVNHGQYTLCLHYIGDPQSAFDRYRQLWEMTSRSERRMEEVMKDSRRRSEEISRKFAAENPGSTTPEPGPTLSFPRSADKLFVEHVCLLIRILVGADRKADAENIRKQALELVSDPRLKSAGSGSETDIVTTKSGITASLPAVDSAAIPAPVPRQRDAVSSPDSSFVPGMRELPPRALRLPSGVQAPSSPKPNGQLTPAQMIDPATGLPTARAGTNARVKIDPRTGLPESGAVAPALPPENTK